MTVCLRVLHLVFLLATTIGIATTVSTVGTILCGITAIGTTIALSIVGIRGVCLLGATIASILGMTLMAIIASTAMVVIMAQITAQTAITLTTMGIIQAIIAILG